LTSTMPPFGCTMFLLNINGLCLDNTLGFCTVKLRHTVITYTLLEKKTISSQKTQLLQYK